MPQQTVIRSLPELQNAVATGQKIKYLYFWGHTPKNGSLKNDSGLDASCFSQWYPAAFQHEGRDFPTAEHFMMFAKAQLFGDEEVANKVLSAKSPGAAKALGRQVQGFQDSLWVNARFEIVVAASIAKFTSSPELTAYLLQTGERVLVEASPVDKIWGIGLDAAAARNLPPSKWQGLNLLGFALMEARDRIRSKSQE